MAPKRPVANSAAQKKKQALNLPENSKLHTERIIASPSERVTDIGVLREFEKAEEADTQSQRGRFQHEPASCCQTN
jgi:hypothetical protein